MPHSLDLVFSFTGLCGIWLFPFPDSLWVPPYPTCAAEEWPWQEMEPHVWSPTLPVLKILRTYTFLRTVHAASVLPWMRFTLKPTKTLTQSGTTPALQAQSFLRSPLAGSVLSNGWLFQRQWCLDLIRKPLLHSPALPPFIPLPAKCLFKTKGKFALTSFMHT